jgi:hypothetical protein
MQDHLFFFAVLHKLSLMLLQASGHSEANVSNLMAKFAAVRGQVLKMSQMMQLSQAGGMVLFVLCDVTTGTDCSSRSSNLCQGR